MGNSWNTRNTLNTFSAILNPAQTASPWRKKNSENSKYSVFSDFSGYPAGWSPLVLAGVDGLAVLAVLGFSRIEPLRLVAMLKEPKRYQ